eukprot:449526-Karenia_brevis.AAC.1
MLSAIGHADYLGKRLCLNDIHDAEIRNRLDKAWAKFFMWKSELCAKHLRFENRLKLFESTVTPTFLYGSGSWTMTVDRARRIQTTQRRMLRWMLGVGRTWEKKDTCESESSGEEPEPEEMEEDGEWKLETWIDWIRR